jgi:hypothetical protein
MLKSMSNRKPVVNTSVAWNANVGVALLTRQEQTLTATAKRTDAKART